MSPDVANSCHITSLLEVFFPNTPGAASSFSQKSYAVFACFFAQALWAKVSTARCEVRPRPEVASEASQPVRLRTGEEQVNDMAANVLLRNIYSAVSELP